MEDEFDWNDEKEEWLKVHRGLSFHNVVEAALLGKVVDDFPSQTAGRANQRTMVILVKDYHVAVPYVEDGQVKFLKTMYMSRKYDARYGGKDAKTHH